MNHLGGEHIKSFKKGLFRQPFFIFSIFNFGVLEYFGSFRLLKENWISLRKAIIISILVVSLG
jgi:hypothetical protein